MFQGWNGQTAFNITTEWAGARVVLDNWQCYGSLLLNVFNKLAKDQINRLKPLKNLVSCWKDEKIPYIKNYWYQICPKIVKIQYPTADYGFIIAVINETGIDQAIILFSCLVFHYYPGMRFTKVKN